jgi:predicted nucleic acid-binding protein
VGVLRALLDTNLLVDFLSGVVEAREEIDRYEDAAISVITWMEVLVGARDPGEDVRLRAFLRRFPLLPLEAPVAEEAVALRRRHRIRIPDAVIWATARVSGRLLVTRNTRDFPAEDPGVRVPYRR